MRIKKRSFMGNMGLVVLEEFIHDRQTDRIAGYYIDNFNGLTFLYSMVLIMYMELYILYTTT